MPFQDLLRRRRHEDVIGVPDQDDALVHPLLRRRLDGVAVAVLAAEEALHPIEGYLRQYGRANSALRRTGLAGPPGTPVDRSGLEPAFDHPREGRQPRQQWPVGDGVERGRWLMPLSRSRRSEV